MKVSLSPAAISEIETIAVHVAIDDVSAALRLAAALFDRSMSLVNAPQRGAIIGRVDRIEIRRLVHGAYLILYSVTGDTVRIHRVVHGARSPRLLLKDLDLS